jgi:hypothetical protein
MKPMRVARKYKDRNYCVVGKLETGQLFELEKDGELYLKIPDTSQLSSAISLSEFCLCAFRSSEKVYPCDGVLTIHMDSDLD